MTAYPYHDLPYVGLSAIAESLRHNADSPRWRVFLPRALPTLHSAFSNPSPEPGRQVNPITIWQTSMPILSLFEA